MSKIFNIAIGILVVAVLATGGYLIYAHFHPPGPKSTLDAEYDQWQGAVDKDPSSALARANLGMVLAEMGKTDDAIREMKSALDIEPDAASYQGALADLYQKAGRDDEAIDIYKQAIDKSVTGAKYEWTYDVAKIYFDQGDMASAQDYVEQSIADNSVIWNSHYLYGQILEKQGDTQKAKDEYKQAATFNTSDPDLNAALKRLS